jgi:GNAT superfamily N-acetyltransferase
MTDTRPGGGDAAPFRVQDPYDWAAILRLIQDAFAGMEGRIDPPSSMHRLDPAAIARQAETGEIWVIEAGGAPVACVFLTARPDVLYLGKLATAAAHRRRGLARRLVDTAKTRARVLGYDRLELQTRIELTENHRFFAALGFAMTGQTAHEGFDRPTSLTMQFKVAQ